MDKLGIIRIITTQGSVFDIPYTEDSMFNQMLVSIRLGECFLADGIFIPFHSISSIVRIPAAVAANELHASTLVAGMRQ